MPMEKKARGAQHTLLNLKEKMANGGLIIFQQIVSWKSSWKMHLMSKCYLAKSIKISAVIMAVLLVPYYGQHIYSNVVSFEAIRNMCFSLLSILFVCLYNGQHGSKKKWIYYWAYPLHILFFAILRCYPFF